MCYLTKRFVLKKTVKKLTNMHRLVELVNHIFHDISQATSDSATVSEVVWKEINEYLQSKAASNNGLLTQFTDALIQQIIKNSASVSYVQMALLSQYLIRIMRFSNQACTELDVHFHQLLLDLIDKKELLNDHIRTMATMLMSRDATFRHAVFEYAIVKRKIFVVDWPVMQHHQQEPHNHHQPQATPVIVTTATNVTHPLFIIIATFAKHYTKAFFDKIAQVFVQYKQHKVYIADLLYRIVLKQKVAPNNNLEMIAETNAWQAITATLMVRKTFLQTSYFCLQFKTRQQKNNNNRKQSSLKL